MAKTWKIRVPDKARVEQLSKQCKISSFLAWLLLNRGVDNLDDVQKFLNPRIESFLTSMDLQTFTPAAQMIFQAIRDQKKIGVHGDYDVDGITSTALLVDFFEAVGVKAEHYLPHRQDDGYGMSAAGIAELGQKGVDFLIAVDCGITDHEPVQKARDSGMTVFIIDHHQAPAELPKADLILDPQLEQGPSDYKDLCSAGLVFFVLLQLRRLLREAGWFDKKSEPNLKRSLDLVALGTVADVAPAAGLNRMLLAAGIKELQGTARFGLRVLKKRARVDEKDLTYGQIAFFLAPRLNAAGRIDEAEPGFELLLEKDPARANALADELERRNLLRQRIEDEIMREAVSQVESDPDFAAKKSIVVSGEDWHPGVIGIVAQRLREKYSRPAFAISFSQGMGRGSGRSVSGLDLYQSLKLCAENLTEYGGHKMACGVSVRRDELEKFKAAFESAVRKLAPGDAFEETLNCDAEVPLYMISGGMIDELEKLRPFGPGNPEPVLVARSVLVLDAQLRKEKHLWLLLREREASFQAMFFRAGIEPPKRGELVDIAYTIERRVWRDQPQLRLMLKDLKRIT
jgi:single-stranded-DNA-specific exonuclease